MKVVSYLILSLSLILNTVTIAQTKEKATFVVNGVIKGMSDETPLYLIRYSTNDTVCKALSKENKFTFHGSVPAGTEYYFIRIDTNLSKHPSKEFLLENRAMKITGKFEEWPKVSLVGSPSNIDFLDFVNLWDSYSKSIKEVDRKMLSYRNNKMLLQAKNKLDEKSENEQNELILKKQSIEKNRSIEVLKFINSRLNSLYIPDLILRVNSNILNESQKEKLFTRLGKKAKVSHFGKLLQKNIEISNLRKKVAPNKIIPDFSVSDVDDKETNLKTLIKGSKYTLIDFWASWCKPCIEKFPSLKAAYNQYQQYGFNIIGVAINDSKSAWEEALGKEKLPWANVRDANKEAFKLFNLFAIPSYILVDDQGKLISAFFPSSSIPSFGPQVHNDNLNSTLVSLFGLTKDVSDIKKTESSQSLNSDTFKLTNYTPLKIGDKMPDIDLGMLYNSPNKLQSVKISDFRGKLVILDFWAIWCAVCIKQFPKMEGLQKKYGEKVAIIPVGFNSKEDGEIVEFLQKRPGLLNLPFLVQKVKDSALKQLFPFSGLPLEVWIDKDGYIVGLTDYLAITDSNVADIIDGKQLSFSIKKKIKKTLDPGESFVFNLKECNLELQGSVMTGYIDTMGNISSEGLYEVKHKPILRYFGVNQPIFKYYSDAYKDSFPEIITEGNKRFFVVSDRKGFYRDWLDFEKDENIDNWKQDKFRKENLFGYELILPQRIGFKEASRYMIEDLDKRFAIKSKIEIRKIPYIKLIRLKGPDLIKSSIPIDSDGSFMNSANRETLELKGIALSQLLPQLNYEIKTSMPIVDETNYKDAVDMKISIKNKSLEAIKTELRKYGLDLVQAEKKTKVLVLYDLRK